MGTTGRDRVAVAHQHKIGNLVLYVEIQWSGHVPRPPPRQISPWTTVCNWVVKILATNLCVELFQERRPLAARTESIETNQSVEWNKQRQHGRRTTVKKARNGIRWSEHVTRRLSVDNWRAQQPQPRATLIRCRSPPLVMDRYQNSEIDMISTLDAFGTGNGANRIQIHMMMVRYCIVLTLFRPFGKLHVACFLGVQWTPSKGCYVSLLCNGYIWNFCCRWF